MNSHFSTQRTLVVKHYELYYLRIYTSRKYSQNIEKHFFSSFVLITICIRFIYFVSSGLTDYVPQLNERRLRCV